MNGKLQDWFFLVLILLGIHQGHTTSADTCCKYHPTPHPTYSCRGCGLSDVPSGIPTKVYTLDLSHNNITLIADHAFTMLLYLDELFLNDNQLRQLGPNALTGLGNLKELDLRKNQLCINDTNLHGLFKDTPNLETLQLVDNKCSETLAEYPNSTLIGLKEIKKLSLPYVQGADLGSAFRELKSLKYLMLMGQGSDGGTLGCNTFMALENVSLEMLSVRNAGIKEMCTSLLQPLKKLNYLNLACNRDLNFSEVIDVVNNLPQPTLLTMIMDGVGAGVPSINISKVPMKTAWKNTEKVSMRFLNTLHIYLAHLNFLSSMPALRYLGVPMNMIWIHYGGKKFKKALIQLFNKTKVETLDVSHFGGQGDVDTFFDKYCYPNNIHEEPDLFFRKPPKDVFPPVAPKTQTFYPDAPISEAQFFFRNIPKSIRYFYVDFFTFGIVDIFQFHYNPQNQVLLLNISNSPYFGRFRSMTNTTNLQIIDARNCGFNNLDTKPLHYPSLKKLILSGNSLNHIGSDKMNWSDFKHLNNLKHLDLGDNKIKFIKQNSFKNLPLLKEVKLQKNLLTNLDLDLMGSSSISFIDVSQNLITFISDKFMQSIEQIASNNKMSLDLTGNPLDCTCKSLQMIVWCHNIKKILKSFENITCNHGSRISDINIIKMKFECFMTKTHLSVVLPSVIPVVLAVFIVVLVYRKRWKIMFRYYLVKDHLHKLRASSTNAEDLGILEDQSEASDVFVSCSDEDTDWLFEELIPRIEELWGFTTFIRQRDTANDRHRLTSTVAALNSAAFRICVISPHFCEDDASLFEFHMILAKREKSFLFLCKEDIGEERFSYINRIMHCYNHLHYGDGDEERQACLESLNKFIQKALTPGAHGTGSD